MELLRHRPLSYRGKTTMHWRPLAIILAIIVAALSLVTVLQRSSLNAATQIRLSREKIACQTNLRALRKVEAGYLTVDKTVNKLVADPDHRSIDTGFMPFISAIFANGDVVADSDYQRALLALIQSVYDYRSGAATADQVGQHADDLLVEGQKAAERTKTLIDAALPQGC